jgi:hypothetical protein
MYGQQNVTFVQYYFINHQAFFFSTARNPLVSKGFVTVRASRSHLVRLLRMSDQLVGETSTRKHTTFTKKKKTNIRSPAGFEPAIPGYALD